MKTSGKDLKNVDTVTLMDKASKLRYPMRICVNAGIISAMAGVPLFNLFGLEDFWILPVLVALIALSIAAYFYYQVLQIKKELATRNISQTEKDIAKANNKKVTIKYVLILLVLALVCFLFSKMDYSSNGDREEGECRNCGRKTSLVAGFDMCATCYEGFVDWQEDNWTED